MSPLPPAHPSIPTPNPDSRALPRASAAIAVSCAGKQSDQAYYALIDSFFKEQRKITAKNVKERALAFARDAGLKTEAFTRCYDKQEPAALIEADVKEGDALGIGSTPTIYINGRKLGGFDGFKDVREIIDEMLAEKAKN